MTTSPAGTLRPRFARSPSGGLRRHPIFSKKSQKIVVFFLEKSKSHKYLFIFNTKDLSMWGEIEKTTRGTITKNGKFSKILAIHDKVMYRMV